MPNWITNRLTIINESEDIVSNKLLSVLTDDGELDFAKFIKLPPSNSVKHDRGCIKSELWGTPWNAMEFINPSSRLRHKPWHSKARTNIKIGYVHRINKKRYKQKLAEMLSNGETISELEFDTGWQIAEPIMLAISASMPNTIFKLTYADRDDIGNNCGTLIIVNGACAQSTIAPPSSQKTDSERANWIKFAQHVTGITDEE